MKTSNQACGHDGFFAVWTTRAAEILRHLITRTPAWPRALSSNRTKVPELCVEYGQQLEFKGNSEDALSMFESALMECQDERDTELAPPSSSGDDITSAAQKAKRLRAVCLAGVARCTLRSGDLRKGLRLAREAG